jgi:acetyl esterase/lipase
MQHDLSDAVAWAVRTGIADPQRVCIMGSSYGGYATFAGALASPQALDVSDVGPTLIGWLTEVSLLLMEHDATGSQ